MAFLKSLVAGLVILALAMLARPILVRALRIKAAAGAAPAAPTTADGRPRPGARRNAGHSEMRRPAPDQEPDDLLDAVIDVRRIDGRINAATAKRVAQLLDRHPDLAAQAMRRWLAEGGDSR